MVTTPLETFALKYIITDKSEILDLLDSSDLERGIYDPDIDVPNWYFIDFYTDTKSGCSIMFFNNKTLKWNNWNEHFSIDDIKGLSIYVLHQIGKKEKDYLVTLSVSEKRYHVFKRKIPKFRLTLNPYPSFENFDIFLKDKTPTLKLSREEVIKKFSDDVLLDI